MAFLDLSVVNIAFAEIMEHFNETSMSTLTWVVSGYAVMFAAFLTPTGRLADTLGRKKVFLGALAGFTVASLVCAAAPSATWLIVGRFGQGAMAAGMIPAALGLIMSSTPREKLTAAIGAWSAAAGFSAVVGPVVGGLLVDQFSWRSVFLINGPIGVLLLIAGLRALPRHEPPAGSRMPDLIGTVSLGLGIGFVVAALTEGERWGWGNAKTVGLLVSGIVLALIALLRSRGHAAPAIDTSLWSSRRFAASNVVSAIFGISLFAYLLAGALFAIGIWRYSILEAAGALSVGAGAAMVGSVIAGRVSSPSAQRVLVVVGTLMFAGCTAIMSTDVFGTEPQFWAAWFPTGLLGGTGLGFAVTALSSTAATALPPMRFAAGVGMNLTARQLGGALGTAGLAAIFAAHGAIDVDAFHTLYRVCTVVSVVAAVAALTLTDGKSAPATTGDQAEAATAVPAKSAS
jgi:EmrB/QacA subfamily drug resistance transporter